MRRAAAQSRGHRRLIAGILLAAGLSRRFGRQKLLESWQGEPMVRRSALAFSTAGLAPIIAVVSSDPRLAQALRGLEVLLVKNRAPESGIAHSIALGVAALSSETPAALIGVADQPYLTADALTALIDAFRVGLIVVPRYGDHRGNPVIFDRRFFPELERLEGDRGGQRVVAAHPEAVHEVALPAAMGVDVDRPEEWPS